MALGKTPDNQFKLRLLGEPQKTYTFQASSNLVDWVEIGNVSLDTNSLDWVDPEAINYRHRYYRAQQK